MGAGEDAAMRANNLPFSDDDDEVWTDSHADGTIGDGCRHTVVITLLVDKTGRRNTLGLSDEAVDRLRKLHQLLHLLPPGVGDRARLRAV